MLLLDSGTYRNDPATHLHNFLTHDGRPPADLRAAARAELAAYDTVTLRDVAATAVRPDGDGFAVDLADGGSVLARRLVLATGLRDTLPTTPGVADLFGTVAAHCPFCHGHEFAGKHVGLLDDETAALLDRAGIAVRAEPVKGFCRSAVGARATFASGPTEELGGLFVTTAFAQAAPFAEQLGLTMLPSGCVEVDVFQRTSLPGVYAAGDLAHQAALPMPMASVLTSAAAGLVAASVVVQDLLVLDDVLRSAV